MNDTENKSEQAPKCHKRHPWIAVLLSLFLPGMGHIYCGKIEPGAALLVVITVFPLCWCVGIVHPNTPVTGISIMFGSIVILATIVAAFDSYRLARRTRCDYRLKDYNNLGVYGMIFVLALGGTLGFASYCRGKVMEAFYVPASSMAPTILNGDRLIANKLAYTSSDPKRGDIVLFKNPGDRQMNYIKRVVALAGDTVQIKDGKLIINEEILQTEQAGQTTVNTGNEIRNAAVYLETNGKATYRTALSDLPPNPENPSVNFGPVTVPEYTCFVMGDNRYHSVDSRHFGPIPIVGIKGKFNLLYWPADSWARFGKLDKQ